MPWQEQTIVTVRKEFVTRAVQEGANIAALCRQYGIARKTGYKWLNRIPLAHTAPSHLVLTHAQAIPILIHRIM